MDWARRTLADPGTYRRLVYLISGMPLGLAWFVALVTVWSLCVGLIITPLVIPLLIGLTVMVRGFAAVEAEVARSLLDVDAYPPAAPRGGGGFWASFRARFTADFWRAQAFLLIRWFVGFPLAAVVVSLLVAALAMIVAPAWLPIVPGGAHLGVWRPHTFAQSLALVPIGLVLLVASLLAVRPLAAIFRHLVIALLPGHDRPAGGAVGGRSPTIPLRRPLAVNAAVSGVVVFALVLIWAVTSQGYFWPIWVIMPLAAVLAIQGWFVVLAEHPAVVDRFRGSRALAGTAGVVVAVEAYLIAIWAVSGAGYFWPVWPLLLFAVVLAALAAAAWLSSPGRAEMAERIETLETSRAGAVDAQDSELRRIERDLHDGAQARLVALGMSLGMAEQKLADDPQRASELLAEARVGAEQALRELRDLARGIHPPVLADRGLAAALASLANATPIPVDLSVHVPGRLAATVESAAYFVAAEGLANAAKHARATRVQIRIDRLGDRLELEVRDDGDGGADPSGNGLSGLRRRVEALDGKLSVRSPRGGPTVVRAELPCG